MRHIYQFSIVGVELIFKIMFHLAIKCIGEKHERLQCKLKKESLILCNYCKSQI